MLLKLSCLILLVLLITTFYLNWKMFEKAAVEGWCSIIPIYNTYKMYQIAKLPLWVFLLSLLLPFIHIYACYKLFRAFDLSTGMAIASLFIPYLGLCCIVFGTYEYEF